MTLLSWADTELHDFAQTGYAIIPSQRRSELDTLREALFKKACSLVPYRGESSVDFFNNFASYDVTGAALNTFRMELVNFLSRELTVSRTLFKAFENVITGLVGTDIVSQKTVNLVIQQPGDPDQVPIHRDAPSNSHFEVILWLPLVDVYKTKSMFILDREHSKSALAMLKNGETYDAFSEYTTANAVDLDVPYGSGLFFAAGLAHGCKVNVETETRWSLNMRYKSLFSPYGPKGLADFFEIINLSPLSEVGFAFERQEFGLGTGA